VCYVSGLNRSGGRLCMVVLGLSFCFLVILSFVFFLPFF
jgi:hypothetical protein